MLLIRNFNIVKIDSKGRLIVPSHIRDYIGLKEGAELIVASNGRKELRIFPLIAGSTARLHITASDGPVSLSRILDIVFRGNLDILTSISRSIDRGKTMEWTAIVDTSACKSMKKVEKSLRKSRLIKSVEVEYR